MHQAVHFLDCDFLLEEACVIGAVSKQWHILGSDCTRESLFLHPVHGGGSGCSRILLSVITTFRIDKEYHLIHVRGFQCRPGEESFYKVCPLQQEDADRTQRLAVDVLAHSIFIFGIMMTVDKLQGEHP